MSSIFRESSKSQGHHRTATPHAVIDAYDAIGQRLRLLAATAAALPRLEDQPSDDFFVMHMARVGDYVQLFIEEYTDEDEPSWNLAQTISLPGPKLVLFPFAVAAAGILFTTGHRTVGISIVDTTTKCGFIFKFIGREEVVARSIEAQCAMNADAQAN